MPRPIIVDADEQVACPKCNRRFALSEGISRHAVERHAEAFAASLDKQRRTLEAELTAAAKRRAEADYEVRRRSLEESIAAKESQLARSRAEELQLRRQMRELEEGKKSQELDYQRKLDAERKKIEERAGTAAVEEIARREAQWKAQLASAQREAADLKRKLEQGSQQLQGEALELSLESLLRSAFPLDEILPVPKGVNGADLVQLRTLAVGPALRRDPVGSQADEGMAAGVAAEAQAPAAGDGRGSRRARHCRDAKGRARAVPA